MKSKLILIVAVVGALAACGQKPAEPTPVGTVTPATGAAAAPSVTVHTVEYYKEHRTERNDVLADCKNRGVDRNGESPEAQNCRAARTAMSDSAIVVTQPTTNGTKF